MKKILLKTKNENVPIFIGKHILTKFKYGEFIKNQDVVIITNTTVAKLYLNKIKNSLKKFTVSTLILPDGERFKNINTLNKIHNFLIKKLFDRQVTIISLGGGVIGDLVGFASDTFMRGVNEPI